MNVIKVTKFLILAGVITVSMVAIPSGKAAPVGTANTLKVSPVRTDLAIDPGSTKIVKITVTNPTNKKIAVKPLQNDFIAGDEEGTPALILDEKEYAPKHSLKRFLKPLQPFEIDANSSTTIETTVAVPKDAEAGGYFGAIRFAPTDPDDGGQVNLSASVASLVLLRVNGDAPEKLELTDFKVIQDGKEGSFFTSADQLSVRARFKNDSPVQLAPFGKISVKKGNKVVYEADFNNKNQQDMVLPDSARKWSLPLEKVEGLGRYTVSATFTYGANNQTIEVAKTFWYVPLNLILVICGALLVVAGVVIALVVRKRYGRTSMSMGSGRKRR